MRTLPLSCADPKKWLEDYQQGRMPVLEFYTFLTMCAKSASAASIVEVVPEHLLAGFKKYILGKAALENEDKIIFFGGTRLYNLQDVRKIADWFAQNPSM